ncbi:hypothetical protein HKBW3S43_00320 [Candidatus Hakubella thermalkaliphila]|uniref:Small ribosomal subunit protein uS9 n=1 Tax=Candidatus Hakubella thermalkaliphila TaxID=2754717 RepID=A0A6V8P6T0_9ACTN|nr:30S ribosomal protein S9 [Candidatus Hakubella thermalkaliphila]GFP27670.1 hypothetical protein HKBW3S33_01080 [Candidatus Hakubella thermalkaliphila]GFP34527.1 hypothetical protein HKBW3S43_00320 [Candidatus Hakubella thermalkaliphila]GFP41158.1 hypothetical protein HKBW3C_00284 [Candidatus Hakubella thermalkaliphila]
MGTIDVALMLLLLVAVATAVVAYVVIYSRKRQQAQNAAEEARREAEEERQREVEQEAVRRAEEDERQRLGAERRQPEEELRKAEEERHKAEEVRRVGEEAQRKAGEEERLKSEAERKRLEPGKRGGRPRASPQDREKQEVQETKQRRPKPEIVCWKRGREWILAVEVPEDLLANSGLAVLQNASPLTQDGFSEGCWCLSQACGQVVVHWNEDEVPRETRIPLGEENYLLFKLSGQNQNQGRRVKSPSSGSYLVMVPDDWERDDALSGPPPVAPQSVSLTGYQAHFYILEKGGDGKIAFLTPEGESVVIESKASRFELVGVRLNDASEDMGPLFGEGPPQIRALDDQAWKDVGTIIVGEEGSGKRKWRTQFSPVPDGMEQGLPSEVLARKGGWYFVRFYDTNDDLVESLDFRFLCALREIRILQPSPLPSEDGHKPVCAEFLHEPGCAVEPADGLACSVQIECEDDKTILTIPPDPVCDETRWLVGPEGGPHVEVTILVERLWWAVGEEDNAPSEWEDQLLTLPCDEFVATSKKALWLRLPRRRWADEVLVGFEKSKASSYAIKVTERTIALPLRNFSDSQEVEDRMQKHPFKVWIKRDDKLIEGVSAVIPLSPSAVQVVSPPTPNWVGFGRKKTAIAKAVLQDGCGGIKVNGRPIWDYFKVAPPKAKRFLRRLLELNQVSEALSRMEVLITVRGSNPTAARQARAAAHALARALMSYDSKLKPSLKQAGFGGVRVTKVSSI